MSTRRRIRTLVGAVALAVTAGMLAPTPAGARPRIDLIPTRIFLEVGPTVVAPAPVTASARIVEGSPTLTGSLTLSLYAPGSGCSGTPTETVSTAIVGGVAVASISRVPDAPGSWSWRATYPGDATHAAAATPCTSQSVLPVGTTPWYPFPSAQSFVLRQFADLLGRNPGTTELSGWTTLLTTGAATADDLVVSLRGSIDHAVHVDPVTRLYAAYFLRIPDAAGLRFWIARIRSGHSLASISDFFAHSSEFEHRYGSLTNRAFVLLVYRNILGRPGEPAGVAYWTALLDSGARTRGEVMAGFSESPEYRRTTAAEVTVSVLYVLMLGRAPTQAEFDRDVTALEAGMLTTAGLVHQIRVSPEYAARIAST